MPLPPRERPKKVADAAILREVVLNTDEVPVGPTVAEIAKATGLAHGPTQRRVQHLMEAGLIEPAYRGFKITDSGAHALELPEE